MPKRLLACLACVFTLFASARFTYVASVCESGWDHVATQWQDTLGFAGLGYEPIGLRPPPEQADWWLHEAERILLREPDSDALRMGAAWVLDSPDPAFLRDYVRFDILGAAFVPTVLDESQELIYGMKTRFREKCLGRCLALSEQATEIAPTDVRWWRLRALLQFEGDTMHGGQAWEARTNDWPAVLAEGEEHDPENALYDYLAALRLWNNSADYDWYSDEAVEEEGHWVLRVRDAEGFAAGADRFAQAQQKPFLAIGEAGYSSIAEFLAKSRLRKSAQADIAVSRRVTLRQNLLVGHLLRWQETRVDRARQKSNADEEARLLRQTLKLYDQAIAPSETTAGHTLTNYGLIRQAAYEAIEDLAERHPDAIAPNDLASIREREESLRIEAATLQAALQELSDARRPNSHKGLWASIGSAAASSSVTALLTIGGVCLLAARCLSRRLEANPVFGLPLQAIAWGLGLVLTFTVLGMAPAEILSRDTQRLILVGGTWGLAALLVAVVVGSVARLLRGRKLRFRLITVFAATAVAAVFASLLPLFRLLLEGVTPPVPWFPEKGWEGLSPEALRAALKLGRDSWEWAAWQWMINHGPFAWLLASLLLATLGFMHRRSRTAGTSLLSYWTTAVRARLSGWLAFLGKTALVAAWCFGILYLSLAPSAIRVVEADFQYKMNYCRNPGAHLAETQEAQSNVLRSAEQMKRIRQEVRFGLNDEDMLEIDYSSE